MQVVKKSSLPTVRLNGEVSAHVFDGSQNGGLSSSAFIVDVAVGVGPRRHRHPYDEIFVIVEGVIRIEAGGEQLDATAEEVVVVPRGVAHSFTNLGPGRAKMVNVHAASVVVTEFADDGPTDVAYEYNHTT